MRMWDGWSVVSERQTLKCRAIDVARFLHVCNGTRSIQQHVYEREKRYAAAGYIIS